VFIVTAEEMRELDRQTIEEIGIPGIVLMENAGVNVAKKAEEVIKGQKGNVIVLTGHGNNGGDGLVVARHLANRGHNVETWLIGDQEKFSKDSLTNYNALINSGYTVKQWKKA